MTSTLFSWMPREKQNLARYGELVSIVWTISHQSDVECPTEDLDIPHLPTENLIADNQARRRVDGLRVRG